MNSRKTIPQLGPLIAALLCLTPFLSPAATVTGEIRDDKTRQLIPARVYIQNDAGTWFFPQSASPEGSAVRYQRQNRANTNAVEQHTTLSAHPFHVELVPGD